MDLNSLGPNSHKSKEESDIPAAKKVITKPLVTPKDHYIGENIFGQTFSAEDAKSVFVGGLEDTIRTGFLPRVKDAGYTASLNFCTKILQFIWYGASGRPSGSGPTNYSAYSHPVFGQTTAQKRATTPTTGGRYSFSDIVFGDRGEAELVKDDLLERMATYRRVSVADVYDEVGKTRDYTDQNYGWDNEEEFVAKTKILTGRGGFIFSFPPVRLIRR